MTKTGKLYGDSLYELALEKNVEQRTYSKELLDAGAIYSKKNKTWTY